MSTDANAYMRLALSLARCAAKKGEVPVGALIVNNGELISTGFNLRESLQSPAAHAEFLAIQRASQRLGTWRLIDCELYVTLEPCIMCTGLIHQARLKNVIFAAPDPKAGALGSLYQLNEDQRLNHNFTVQSGMGEDESRMLLRNFFRQRRNKI